MSARVSRRIGAVAAGLSVLLLGVAVAQQSSQSGSQVKPSQYRGNESSSATQSSRDDSAQSQSTSQTGRKYTANFRGTTGTETGQSAELDHYLAQCVVASNQSEVELGELAQQQAQNPQVKQFAQEMVQAHRQMIQQVQRLAGMQGGSTRGSSSSAIPGQSDTSTSSTDRSSATTSPSSSTSPSTTADQAAPGVISSSSAQGISTAGQATSEGNALSSSRPSTATAGGDTASLVGAAGSGELQQFAQIGHQINTRMMQMVKDELQQKSGAEFDKCYIGNAIGAHMYSLAALEVIGQQSHGQLAQIAQQAQPKVQQHLEMAKQIMKQLDGQAGGTASSATGTENQAERPTSRTQR